MFKVSLSDALALFGGVLAILLVVLDKAGKLKGPLLLILLGVAAALTLPMALSFRWVAEASPAMLKFSRGMLVTFSVGLVYSAIAVWISGPAASENVPALLQPKPEFRVLDLTAFPQLVVLDVNVFRVAANQEGAIVPIVAGFENVPRENGFNETDEVWAQIIYRERELHDSELLRANVGCWIDQPVPDINLPFRQHRFLLLGGWHSQGRQPLLNEFRIFEYSRDLHRPIERRESIAAPRSLLIEVILTRRGDNQSVCEYRFNVPFFRPGAYSRELLNG